MKASDIRKSILQAAVQGKLVPQNAHDEPASALLERIRAEKARLAKEGKLKKEKPLPPITEDEIPYDLPEGWVWCRLGNVIQLGENLNIHKELPAGTIINYVDIDAVDNLKYRIRNSKQESVEKLSSRARRVLKKGYILYSLVRPYLNNIAIIEEDKENYIGSTGFVVFRPFSIPLGYFVTVLLSDYINNHFKSLLSGFNSPSVSQGDFLSTPFPLPPLAEQQRIVAKVDELMALCDELEAAEQELEALEGRFTEYLPKSILQAAVQGKLVPQNIHDEPATSLLKRISAEKKRLVKEGKLKKEKPLPPITEDEIPYDLPERWVWCRLGDIIIQNIGGGTPSKQNPAYWNGNIPWASVKDLSSSFLSKTKDKITELGLQESSSNLIPANSIIVCTRMGLGKITTNVIPVAINQDLRALIISDVNINSQYVIQYYNTLNIKGGGTTVKGITVEELHNIPFPLPPLAEQQRIVAKVNRLMALCDELKAVKALPIEKADVASRGVIDFPKTKPEESLQLAARGEISKKPSAEFMQAIDDMFKGDV